MKPYKSLKFIGVWFLLLAVLGCSLIVFADTDIGGGSSGESGGGSASNGYGVAIDGQAFVGFRFTIVDANGVEPFEQPQGVRA